MEMPDNYPEKSDNKMRVFDDDGYRQRAACICVRNETEDQILLITSHRDPTSWIIPGGGVEPNESVNDAAHRELYEEAGVKGRIVRQLGIFDNDERKNRTSVFVVHVEEEFDDWDEKRSLGRERYWHKISHAFSLLHLHRPFQLTFLERFICTSPNHHQLLNEIQKEI